MPLKDIKKFFPWILSVDLIVLSPPIRDKCRLELLLAIVFVLKLFKLIELAAPGDDIKALIFDLFGPTDKFAFRILLS
jgi:hypothetical protein